MNWTTIEPLEIGDTFTIAGKYKKRSFMQWLRKEPKQLKKYKVKAKASSYMEYTE